MNETLGEKLVGITFNVDNLTDVAECKVRFAQAIDQIEAHKEECIKQGLLSLNKEMIINEAKKQIINAQMWGVKAITYAHD